MFIQGDCRVIALSETTRDQVVQSINLFLASMVYRVLVVSYEVCVYLCILACSIIERREQRNLHLGGKYEGNTGSRGGEELTHK